MRFTQSQLLQLFVKHLASLALILLFTFFLRQVSKSLNQQLIALLYLLPIMISTVLWGLTPGVLAAFAAFLAYNYFFIPPYYTLMVHKTQDLITLIMFLVISVVMSQLIGQAREGMRLAKNREMEATRMYELITALSGVQENPDLARILAEQIIETFRLEKVQILIEQRPNRPPVTVTLPITTKISSVPSVTMPIMTARKLEGEIRLWRGSNPLSTEEQRLLEAYSSQAALTIDRIWLTEIEYKSRILEESDHVKSALLSSVSHELRSPLAAIKASVSSLRSGIVDWNSPAREELVATIDEETDHLNLLVGNLLEMSRIESGALKLQRRWNSIEEITTGVLTKMHKILENYRVQLDFPDNLPLIPSDYVLLEQVFTNLISNSVKYSPVHSVIQISARKEVDNLHVKVSNQGPPVAKEHLERIFDKFHRVTSADRVTGTGLGLSICKGIIDAHGGMIWAENTPSGFCFNFSLPLTIDGSLPDLPVEER